MGTLRLRGAEGLICPKFYTKFFFLLLCPDFPHCLPEFGRAVAPPAPLPRTPMNVYMYILFSFQVDPLFQKTSATFDEGGSGGLLLNQLYCINDSSAIVLDSKTMVTGTRDTPVERSQVVDLTEIKGRGVSCTILRTRVCVVRTLEIIKFP